ncbi:AN1-like Zinc finger containing protein, putative [Angomonas deanei]|uniref:AN1-like Zinc finger containing protein, putative n=1 Tax=Angomonas deanei TaxID=59799 RepID=A0A7G2CTP9_9TRYP|nr:AN1-like Zinc finger containing protein, putative [Angomonas deanei]
MQVGISDEERFCSFPGCTVNDNLAATCSNCKKLFCSAHISFSAHHCEAAPNAIVATCPVCNAVVPFEFLGQPVDEAVSRHIDRGCKNVPQTGGKLGGSAKCTFQGCPAPWTVTCPDCRKRFCVTHSAPAMRHNCSHATATKPKERVTPPPQKSPTATASSPSLLFPRNSISSALGKATERREDMIVPLVSFLIPTGKTATPYEPVAPFFYHVHKSMTVGRVVDLIVDEGGKQSTAVASRRDQRWNVFFIEVPTPEGATAAMYPAQSLGTFVRQTSIGESSANAQLLWVVTPLESLPQEAFDKSLPIRVIRESSSGNGKQKQDCAVL